MGVVVCLVMRWAGPGRVGVRGWWCGWVVGGWAMLGRDGGLVARGWRGGALVWWMHPG